ncbi:hypothetical protein [Ralstonia soli]|uniref:Uncharacterized protein n=1 Tax=Ralstonia soli TaxID=2953896 RepID=A0ABT1ALJ0_9RALS|nr:hypothetical protein [Ralstonia soli]MCO5398957.1 hypothetical protein [Ralstonia soli]
MTTNLQNVGATSALVARRRCCNAISLHCEERPRGAGAPGRTRSTFYLTTGRPVVRARKRFARKESTQPSLEAHKFRDIKPFNFGMEKHT